MTGVVILVFLAMLAIMFISLAAAFAIIDHFLFSFGGAILGILVWISGSALAVYGGAWVLYQMGLHLV